MLRPAVAGPGEEREGHPQAQALEKPRDEGGGQRVEAEAVAEALLLLLRQQADERVEQEAPGTGPGADPRTLPVGLGRAHERRVVDDAVADDLALGPLAQAIDDEAVLGELGLRAHLVGPLAEHDRGAGEGRPDPIRALGAHAQRQEPPAPHLGRGRGPRRETRLLAVADAPATVRAGAPTSSCRRARRTRRGRCGCRTAPRPCRGASSGDTSRNSKNSQKFALSLSVCHSAWGSRTGCWRRGRAAGS